MESPEKVLTIEPAAAWSVEAEYLTAQALQHASTAEVRAQVEQGGARLFHVLHEGAIIGAYVLRIDYTADGDEGVIVTASGGVPGVDLIASILSTIEQQLKGCRAIRFHTARTALARRMHALGYDASEIVCRKILQ